LFRKSIARLKGVIDIELHVRLLIRFDPCLEHVGIGEDKLQLMLESFFLALQAEITLIASIPSLLQHGLHAHELLHAGGILLLPQGIDVALHSAHESGDGIPPERFGGGFGALGWEMRRRKPS
jgi:hypothetical protein